MTDETPLNDYITSIKQQLEDLRALADNFDSNLAETVGQACNGIGYDINKIDHLTQQLDVVETNFVQFPKHLVRPLMELINEKRESLKHDVAQWDAAWMILFRLD